VTDFYIGAALIGIGFLLLIATCLAIVFTGHTVMRWRNLSHKEIERRFREEGGSDVREGPDDHIVAHYGGEHENRKDG